MARIKKFAGDIPQGLSSIQTFLIDNNPNSDYFRITDFKDTFTGGKNGFLIEGSEFLKETTEVKIEILDVDGNTIYYEPGDGIPEYYEGISKVVSVHIYEDTPIGIAKITVLGELKQYLDSGGVLRDVPEEWKGLYNVKWEKSFKINKNLTNEDKVRFYRRPDVAITEIARPIFTANPESITQTGNVLGTPIIPSPGTNITTFPRPSQYLLTTLDNTRWTGSVVNSTIEVDGQTLNPLEVVSDTELIVSTPYTENNIVTSFTNKSYSTTFNYIRNDEGLGTALSGSFGKFVITNLETFVGDVYRVKVFRTSQADLTDFQFVQEIVLESTEILIDYEQSQRDEESYGLFTPFVLDNYWITSSNDITTEFNQSFLFNSVKLDSTGTNTFHTINNVPISNNIEYTLSFNTRIPSVVGDNSIEVYLQGTKNGTQITQTIGTIQASSTLLQKTAQEFNFIARDFDDCKLYFKVTGQDWYISTVSLRAAQESSFSPDEITFIQTVPRTLEQETFDFRFEFYDINNNYIPVLVTATKTFTAGNLNEIQKNIEIVATSLYFQFDSGSQQGNALPPKSIFFDINKDFLTGSTNFTSGAYDNDNNLLSASEYSATFYPGLLDEISTDRYRLTVENFTGSIYDNVVQYITYTAECEGVTDNITISRLADGKGGVNFDIRPFRGSVIRNSDPTSSVEIQAVRIDGINEVNLRDGLPLDYSIPLLYVTSASLEGNVSYITLEEASSSGFIIGLNAGTTGSGEINYNAEFNRDAIDGQRTVYLIPSTSPVSQSILTSLTLTDLQDGLNTGEILYDSETFGVNPYVSFQNPSFAKTFTPVKSSVTGSFFRRGETSSPVSGTLDIYPSMSINEDYVPFFWMYYATGGFNEDVSVVVRNENGVEVQPTGSGTFSGSFSSQNKQLSVTFTYNEPFTTASVSVEKTFTIVPEGKAGDDAITIEIDPRSIILQADESRVVSDYSPSISEIRVKQGNTVQGILQYSEDPEPGSFYIDPDSVSAVNVDFNGFSQAGQGDTTIVTAELTDFSTEEANKIGRITYPIAIRPFFTSSQYITFISQSVFRQDRGKASRGLTLTADTNTVTYDGNGNLSAPSGDITLTATAFNTTGSGNINFYFFKDDSLFDIVNQNSSTVTKAVPSSEFPAGGVIQTYRVELHDGNADAAAIPDAIASTTINGVGDGVPNYQAIVNNQNGFALYKVGGDLVFDNTSTTIEAYKGNEKLTHVSSYSFPTFDDLGNVIPNGEYQVTIHSFSAHLDLAGSLASQSLLTTNGSGEAFMDVLDDWTDPVDTTTLEPENGTGTIVFRVDFEDGRESALVQQNLSVQYEGNIGPGIIMRGVYTSSLNYQFDVPRKRRDAVIFPDPTGPSGDGSTYYWATLQPSGPGFGGAQAPPTIVGEPSEDPRDANAYWEYLGKEEFFVAAKMAIFEESFVKNTINVGNNPGNEFANIVIAGGRTDPFIAIGQSGTLGTSGDQTNTGVIGYNRPGIFLGMSEDATEPRLSLRNDSLTNALLWDGSNLIISGALYAEIGEIGGWAVDSDSIFSGTKDVTEYSTNGITLSSTGGIHTPYFYSTLNEAGFSGSINLSALGQAEASFTTAGTFLSVDGWVSSRGFWFDSTGNAQARSGFSVTNAQNDPPSLENISVYMGNIADFNQDDLFNGIYILGAQNTADYQGIRWINYNDITQEVSSRANIWTHGDFELISNGNSVDINLTTFGGNNNIRFWPTNAIINRGNVFVGTSDSSYTIFLEQSTGDIETEGGIFTLGNIFAGIPNKLGYDDATSGVSIYSDGNIKASADIIADGNITAYYSSDERLKLNIKPIQKSLSKILQIGGYTFDWDETKQDTLKGNDIGVIAQEIQKVLPEVVNEKRDGYLGVRYEKIVPLLIEGIKELSQKVDELEKKLKEK